MILANAKYWVDYLTERPQKQPPGDNDLQGAARALEALLDLEEAGNLQQSLALALHPHMERRGHWGEWQPIIEYLLRLARRRSDPHARIELSLQHGAVQRQLGDVDAAIRAYRTAWRLARRHDAPLKYAVALVNLGAIYRQQASFQRAEVLCKGALRIFEKLGEIARAGYAENTLGVIYLNQAFWSQAHAHFQQAKRRFEEEEIDGLAVVARNLGILHTYTHELNTAEAHLDQAVHYYQVLRDDVNLARVQLNVANLCLELGDLTKAELAGLRAEKILKRTGDSLNLARTRHNLGMVYTQSGQPEEAERCFKQAINQWAHRDDTWNLANSLGELGNLYLLEERWAKAETCLERAWSLVAHKEESMYASLQQEITERRQKLDSAVGHYTT